MASHDDFKYIRNRIRELKMHPLLEACLSVLRKNQNDSKFPHFIILTLIKWTLLHAENKYPAKELTHQNFDKLLKSVSEFNSGHISRYLKNNKVQQAFQILYNQQFYLQRDVYLGVLASQIKLLEVIRHKYDINGAFIKITGISVQQFVRCMFILYGSCTFDSQLKKQIDFNGSFDLNVTNIFEQVIPPEVLSIFFDLVTLTPFNAKSGIKRFKHGMKNPDLQYLETSFLTQFPFMLINDRIHLVHNSLLTYACNYFLYDFLKQNDPSFSEELGRRMEKYTELGLIEAGLEYVPENQLKKQLPKDSNVVEFYIPRDNILIECKAIEPPAITSVVPDEKILFNGFKSTLISAYVKQMLSVGAELDGNDEKWGIIITYKEFFWHHFVDLYDLISEFLPNEPDTSILPPENVFIIDLYTWDKVIHIVKNGDTTLLALLREARETQSGDNKKGSFRQHLERFYPIRLDPSYLNDEVELLIRND